MAKPKPNLIDNIGAFHGAFGIDWAPLTFDFSRLDWPTAAARDEFIRLITE